jgi:hypothetical protein
LIIANLNYTNLEFVTFTTLYIRFKLEIESIMAKENPKSPIMFTGTLGNIIAYIVNGKTYYRRKPEKKYFANTEKQLQQHTQFLACQKLAQKVMDPVNKQIWNKQSKNKRGFNFFKKTNYHAFNSSGNISSFENLKFSLGDLLLPEDIQFKNYLSCNGSVTISWSDDSDSIDAYPSDWLRIIAICEEEVITVEGITAKRSDENTTFRLPWGNGSNVHLYAYFIKKNNKKASNNYYQMLLLKDAEL